MYLSSYFLERLEFLIRKAANGKFKDHNSEYFANFIHNSKSAANLKLRFRPSALKYKSLFQKDSEESFTVGAGFMHKIINGVSIRFDYSYADFGRLENAQRFSFGFEF